MHNGKPHKVQLVAPDDVKIIDVQILHHQLTVRCTGIYFLELLELKMSLIIEKMKRALVKHIDQSECVCHTEADCSDFSHELQDCAWCESNELVDNIHPPLSFVERVKLTRAAENKFCEEHRESSIKSVREWLKKEHSIPADEYRISVGLINGQEDIRIL